MWLVGGVHCTVWIFIGVCSITRFGLFVLLGCFPSPRLVGSARPPLRVLITGWLGYICQSAPPPLSILPGVSLLIPSPWGDDLHRESSVASWTARFCPSLFWQSVFITIFIIMPLKELLCLPQAFDELGRLDIMKVGVSSDCETLYVDRQSCWNPVLLFFDRQLALVLSLISVGGREEVKFQF